MRVAISALLFLSVLSYRLAAHVPGYFRQVAVLRALKIPLY